MLSIKKQYVTWFVWTIISPLLFLLTFNETAEIELFSNLAFYVLIILGVVVALFPINFKGATIFLINSVSLAAFIIFGLFAEMTVTVVATLAILIRIKVSKEELYRIPINLLMFQMTSVLSALAYYLVEDRFVSIWGFQISLTSLTIYFITYVTLNRVILYLVETKWQKKDYGKLFGYEYFFSIFSCVYVIPIALTINYLHVLYDVPGIVIATLPLIAFSVLFKLYFLSDSQNFYLAEINKLAGKMTGIYTQEEIISLYLDSWVDIFPADTIYYYSVDEKQMLTKIYQYHDRLPVKENKLTDPLTNHTVLEKAWREDEILSFGTAKERAQLLLPELIYPAESMLVLPVKRAHKVIGLLVMTDPKRHVYTKNIMTMVPILHSYFNIALENANNFEELQTNSRTDHLTGLSNMRSFEDYLNLTHQSKPESNLSIIIIDLDHFKKINDTYGHQAGNELLKQVAILLNTFVYEDERLARYGGEEFIFFVPNLKLLETLALAESIRKKIEETDFNTHNYLADRELVTLNITASIGFATYPEQCENVKDLMTMADRAMYVGSKQKGRNRVASLYEGESDETEEDFAPETVF
ncbi:GGDEF domain-containing protein [Marinilactibacillus piezotolerans]|uniref:GGDEF domain-containing protein n=1 Tax=Marinilactibacillus piezotolerans TaxID=258723 RepID=UPI0015C42A0C|nr:GGDEF domain-containing protein [Marinilactibacillus piezotolerans]